MKIYNVYVDPEASDKLESAIFVKEGFSITAAVMSFFWMAYHRIWLVGSIFFAVHMVLSALDKKHLLHHDALTIIALGLMVFVGYNAHDWYGKSLTKRGKVLFDVVSGKNQPEAEQRFFDAYLNDRQA